MPKLTAYPRLRTKIYRGAKGQVYVYYTYDMRPDGKPDVRLGADREQALKRWDELHNQLPQTVGTLEEAFAEWEERVLPTYANANTRAGYAKGLKKLRPAFGKAGWAGVKLKHLVGYLEKRKGKTQANREMALLQIVWNYARIRGMTELPYPAAGMQRSKWKNEETPRTVEVRPEVFDAIYAEGDMVLRDAMDLASATGMRITDGRTVVMPKDAILRYTASKTGKRIEIDVSESHILLDVIERRRANRSAEHLMLLAGPFKRPVSERMLTDRFSAARARAAINAREAGDEPLAEAIAGMILRDCRKYAADLADSVEDAQRLLQHANPATTRRHYRTRPDQAKSVR
jgi:integrase